MKVIRWNAKYSLIKTNECLYFVERRKDKKKSGLMTKDEAESLILDEGFNKECEQLIYS